MVDCVWDFIIRFPDFFVTKRILSNTLQTLPSSPPQPSDTSPNPSSNMGDGWLRVRVGMVLELSPNLCLDVETAVNRYMNPILHRYNPMTIKVFLMVIKKSA